MPEKKKDEPRQKLTIDYVGSRGDGVAPRGDDNIFVPFTAPGDEVEVTLEAAGRGTFKGTQSKILREGPHRQKPPCRHFGACGGCDLQHLSDACYADWLKERIATALSHQGILDAPIEDAIISPPGSRRRMTLSYFKKGNSVELGFNARARKQIIDLQECPVARPELVALFGPLRQLVQVLALARSGDIHLTATDTGVAVTLTLADEPDLETLERLVDFADAVDLAALYVRAEGLVEPVVIRRNPVAHFDGIPVDVPPGAFLQATNEGEAALISAVMEAAGGAHLVADLFSGLGTFALPLTRVARVRSVEGDLRLVEAQQAVWNRAKGQDTSLSELVVEHRDLFRRPLSVEELNAFDCVVFDPPRAGAKALVPELAASEVKTVVAVSCNPNTFGRDARQLLDGGYRLSSIKPIDQFRWSHHVELVGVFEKG